ncbi:MAG: acyl carrier protein [Oscillospiraceae bacterium]|nr:acyl carrier protein [Oscillospiraceae bacterium]
MVIEMNINKIIEIISKYAAEPKAEINENTNLLQDLHMESMSFIDMICEFEGEFKRAIPERDFRKFITVKKIAAYLESGQSTVSSEQSADTENTTGFIRSHCIVSPLTKKLAQKVPALVTAVYGTEYPSAYLYNPDEFWAKTEKGDIYPYIAINGEGKATGMISLIRLSVNSNAFELGQLMVTPEYRGTNVAELLISCISSQELGFGVIYCESVTTHKFSQRSCIAGGFCDTAIKLNIMAPYENNSPGRISCVVSCIERGEMELWAYLPQVYKEEIALSLEGLSTRVCRNASDISPNNPTLYTVNDDELTTSQYIIVSITEIGNDSAEMVQKLEEYAIKNQIKSLAVNIPLACPHNGAMVNALRSMGFFFTGVMPRWYRDSDALLMQKLYPNTPEWDKIKLFSDKIQAIAEKIKKSVPAIGG